MSIGVIVRKKNKKKDRMRNQYDDEREARKKTIVLVVRFRNRRRASCIYGRLTRQKKNEKRAYAIHFAGSRLRVMEV